MMTVVMSVVIIEKRVLFANYVGLMILGAIVLSVGVALATNVIVVIIPSICKSTEEKAVTRV